MKDNAKDTELCDLDDHAVVKLQGCGRKSSYGYPLFLGLMCYNIYIPHKQNILPLDIYSSYNKHATHRSMGRWVVVCFLYEHLGETGPILRTIIPIYLALCGR